MDAVKLKEDFGKAVVFFRNNIWWIQYVLLAVIIIIGIFIRIQPIDKLIDTTTGQYISIELDSTHFYRYAQIIAQNGTLPEVDYMRSAPLGQEAGFYGYYVSYFIAYLWKFLHLFSSDITVEYVDVLYPVIAMAIMSIFFFLLLSKLTNWKVSTLATLFINVIPAFLFRSLGGSSDHDILVMMFVIMSFYFYFVAWDAKKLRNNILFGIIAGISSFLAMSTGGAGRFIFLIIGATILLSILIGNFKEKDFYVLLSWLITFTVLMLLTGVNILLFISSISIAPAYFAVLVVLFDYILFKKDYFKISAKLSGKMPQSLASFLFAFIFGIIFVFIFLGANVFVQDLTRIYNILFHAFQYGRIGLTVSENQRPYVANWFAQFGASYVLFFIAGAIVIFYKAVKSVTTQRKNLTIAFAVFIILYIFSRYAPGTLLDGESTFSKVLFFGSIIFFIGFILYVYLSSFYRKSLAYKELSGINRNYLFLIIWFLALVIGATSAVRLFFEFSPTTVALSSFFLVFVFDWFISFKEKIITFLGVLLIVLVLFSPFSFAKGIIVSDYQQSYTQASYSGPSYNPTWQLAGKWARENTPPGSIFVHWWDYGYWVQTGFQRPTVTDGGNLIGWWNYLVGRNVLTARSFEEPLKFLKAHDVSYLLIISDEIGKYPAYSSIGSDLNYDRFGALTTFIIDQMSTQETREGVVLFYRGGFSIDEDLVLNGKVYPRRQAIISSVETQFTNVFNQEQNATLQMVGQPNAIINYNNEQIKLPMRCLYLGNQVIYFENYTYGGCFRVIPVIQGDQVYPSGAGIFLSPRVSESLFTRLYLFDESNPYYELVYDSNQEVNLPLVVYQGSLIGPIKIWKVNYPDDLNLTDEEMNYYLRKDYADPELEKPKLEYY